MARGGRKIEAFADQLGALLGSERKARTWLNQQQQIAKTLTGIRDTASSLLTDSECPLDGTLARWPPLSARVAAFVLGWGPGR
jgi:hypothetical protein